MTASEMEAMLSPRLMLALELAPRRGLLLLRVTDAPDVMRVLVEQLAARGLTSNVSDRLDVLEPGAVNLVDVRQWNDDAMRAANLARPLVSDRRVVLVVAPSQLAALRERAPDLFDWISHADGLSERDGLV